MRLWPRSLLPKTLAVQLIAVTAVAVMLSNLGVAAYFDHFNVTQNESFLNERMIDRAQAVATTLREVPPQARGIVMRTMGSWNWKFSQMPHDAAVGEPMNDEEAGLARRIADLLPTDQARDGAVTVHTHLPLTAIPPVRRPHIHPPPRTEAVQILLPIDAKTMLSAVNLRTPPQPPVEIIAATIVAILLASIAAVFVARRVVRPLSELTRAASLGATSGGVVPRVPETGPEDVRAAASAFNAMTEKVAKTLESQRHLLSAVGHDLRTPITAMRINLEFVTDDDLREGLERNLGELQDLTEQVLSAAKGTGGETRRNVDLSALVESLCTDLDEMGEPVTWAAHAPAPISCRPNEIRRAVRNLVENAVAYGGEADVKIADTPGAYEIMVEDRGPGIPEADRQRVFEPFVRLETSRNREGGGTGLGLTLVKAIAEGHGGQITLENKPGGGLRARMTLPRTAVPA
jgi:signal transduction histidine kinase